MPTFDENGVPQYADWSADEQASLLANFKALDPDRNGVNRTQLRAFYTHIGWNDFQKGIDALVASGQVESKIGYLAGRPVEVYTWKGA